MIVLAQSDSGKTVSLQTGEVIELRLDENATTGFLWSLDELPPGLNVIDDEMVPAGTMQPGAAGERVFRLKAADTVDADVTLSLTRPWESGTPEATFQVHITVT